MNVARSLENLKLEQDAIALYDALSTIERNPRRQAAFRHIAANERRHADVWATRLREAGAEPPPAGRPRARVRFIILSARLLGTGAVADLVRALEGDELEAYEGQGATPELQSIAADEREHAAIWDRLDRGEGHESSPGRRAVVASASATEVVTAAAHPPIPVGAGRAAPDRIARLEGWHRTARSGTLRAIIFGVSDGLVSNLALVMGVAGASGQDRFILMAGVAGLLAGAFSMAAGEYISMQSQRELFERQIELERAELEAMPEEEQRELAAIYVGKGLPRPAAEQLAAHMFEDPDVALDALVREELGLDPDELGSPWGAAIGSFIAFAIGAIVPVLPYLVATGTAAFAASIGLSLVALFAVGAMVSLLTGRGLVFSGLRQLTIGAGAAGVTYLVGRIIGVGVAG